MVLPVSLASGLHEAVKKSPAWDCVIVLGYAWVWGHFITLWQQGVYTL